MNKFMKLILAVLLLVPSLASAEIGWRNLEEDVKHQEFCLAGYPEIGTATTSESVTGLNGVIFDTSLNGVSTPTSTAGASGSVASLLWPARLKVQILDAYPVATVSCTTITITGTDQHGKNISEEVSGSETVQTTTKVFSNVTKISGTGCANGGANDELTVWPSQHLWVGADIRSYTDVEAACIADASDSSNVKCAKSNDGTDDDLQTNVDLEKDTVNVGATIFVGSSTTAAADGDDICIRTRSGK